MHLFFCCFNNELLKSLIGVFCSLFFSIFIWQNMVRLSRFCLCTLLKGMIKGRWWFALICERSLCHSLKCWMERPVVCLSGAVENVREPRAVNKPNVMQTMLYEHPEEREKGRQWNIIRWSFEKKREYAWN